MSDNRISATDQRALRSEQAGVLTEEGAAFARSSAPNRTHATTRKAVIVIGGGQAGLSVGYHLQRLGIDDFLILDAAARIGDSWRDRWDSLRLFTPAMYDGLDGMPFPGSRSAFPTKDQMGDYLEAYASRFRLPVLGGTRVDSLTRVGDRYIIEAGDRHFEARQVVVAMSNYQVPRLPAFAAQLDPAIHQIHTRDYNNPGQLSEGDVLIVGAGNSAAEIAKDLGARHRIFMAGPSTGEIPGSFDSFFNQHILVHILFRLVFRHILSVNTPIGRTARPKIIKHGAPLIRVKSRDLAELDVQRAGRVVGAREGLPLLEDGTALRVSNIVWCTGFEPGFSWINLPILLADGKPGHERGIIANEPGLYFVGLHFLTAMSSAMIQGVGRDARRIVETISRRIREADAGNGR